MLVTKWVYWCYFYGVVKQFYSGVLNIEYGRRFPLQ